MTINPHKTSGTSTETTIFQENSTQLSWIAGCVPCSSVYPLSLSLSPPPPTASPHVCLTSSSAIPLLFLLDIGVHFLSSLSYPLNFILWERSGINDSHTDMISDKALKIRNPKGNGILIDNIHEPHKILLYLQTPEKKNTSFEMLAALLFLPNESLFATLLFYLWNKTECYKVSNIQPSFKKSSNVIWFNSIAWRL